jgi:hypothetical protein
MVSMVGWWWGRWPLGSDEFSESGVEFWSGWRVDAAVGFVEGELGVGIAFDGPAVFVEEPVVEGAEQDQVGEVGGPTVSPMLDVVSVDPTSVGTSDEPTSCVPMPELTS